MIYAEYIKFWVFSTLSPKWNNEHLI